MERELFAARLKDAMAARGLKQVDLVRAAEAQGVKLGKSHVSQYVSGKTMPRADVLRFLAEALEVDEGWLSGSAVQGAVPASAPVLHDIHEGAAPAPVTRGETTMREFKKSSKLDNVLYDVRGPVVDTAERMEAEGTQVLKLNIGNPAPFGFRTPDEVVYDMRRQLIDCEGYSASKGLFSARKAIMQYAQLKGLPNVTIEDVYTGNGASELINLSMSALVDDGDEVLVPSPTTPCGPPA